MWRMLDDALDPGAEDCRVLPAPKAAPARTRTRTNGSTSASTEARCPSTNNPSCGYLTANCRAARAGTESQFCCSNLCGCPGTLRYIVSIIAYQANRSRHCLGDITDRAVSCSPAAGSTVFCRATRKQTAQYTVITAALEPQSGTPARWIQDQDVHTCTVSPIVGSLLVVESGPPRNPPRSLLSSVLPSSSSSSLCL